MKLRLQLDELAVESFDTTATEPARGTVFGEQCTCDTACTCPGCPTCYESCNGTCDQNTCPNCPTCQASCDGTCIQNTCWDSCNFSCNQTCRPLQCGPYYQEP